jgi:hypothetical protein
MQRISDFKMGEFSNARELFFIGTGEMRSILYLESHPVIRKGHGY